MNAPLARTRPGSTGPVPEPARPVTGTFVCPPRRPSLADLSARVTAALGTEAFPAVLLAVLQDAYPTGCVSMRWGNPGESVDPAAPAPWLHAHDVSLWLPAGAGDDDLRGWLLGLIAAQRELQRAQHRTDFLARLVSVLAHEVRNPLTVVMGALELAQREPGVPDPVRATLTAARRTAARIETVTRAATDMARNALGTDPEPSSADHFTLQRALTAGVAR